MRDEINAAVKFLRFYLYKKFNKTEIDKLEKVLEKKLRKMYHGHWHVNNPDRGCGFRCLKLGKPQADKIIRDAAKCAGLNEEEVIDSMPFNLMMWIDPGEVSYSEGKRGYAYTAFKKNPLESVDNESDISSTDESIEETNIKGHENQLRNGIELTTLNFPNSSNIQYPANIEFQRQNNNNAIPNHKLPANINLSNLNFQNSLTAQYPVNSEFQEQNCNNTFVNPDLTNTLSQLLSQSPSLLSSLLSPQDSMAYIPSLSLNDNKCNYDETAINPWYGGVENTFGCGMRDMLKNIINAIPSTPQPLQHSFNNQNRPNCKNMTLPRMDSQQQMTTPISEQTQINLSHPDQQLGSTSSSKYIPFHKVDPVMLTELINCENHNRANNNIEKQVQSSIISLLPYLKEAMTGYTEVSADLLQRLIFQNRTTVVAFEDLVSLYVNVFQAIADSNSTLQNQSTNQNFTYNLSYQNNENVSYAGLDSLASDNNYGNMFIHNDQQIPYHGYYQIPAHIQVPHIQHNNAMNLVNYNAAIIPPNHANYAVYPQFNSNLIAPNTGYYNQH